MLITDETHSPDSWLQWLAIGIIHNITTRVFDRKAWMSHRYSVERPVIVLPIFVPAKTFSRLVRSRGMHCERCQDWREVNTSHVDESPSRAHIKHSKCPWIIRNWISKRKWLTERLPVSLVRRWNVLWMPPLTHLKHPNEKHWVDPGQSRRHGDAHKLPSPFRGIAEIECAGKCLQLTV